MKNAYLIGLRCYLRPLERDDAPALATYLNDGEVTRTLAQFRPISCAAEAEFIEGIAKDPSQLVLGICDAADDALVGVCGLTQIHPSNRHACFGLFIGDRARWGRGLGTEVTRLMTGLAFESSPTTSAPSAPIGASAIARKASCGRTSSAKAGSTTPW